MEARNFWPVVLASVGAGGVGGASVVSPVSQTSACSDGVGANATFIGLCRIASVPPVGETIVSDPSRSSGFSSNHRGYGGTLSSIFQESHTRSTAGVASDGLASGTCRSVGAIVGEQHVATSWDGLAFYFWVVEVELLSTSGCTRGGVANHLASCATER